MSICEWFWPIRANENDLNPANVFGSYLQAIDQMESEPASSDDEKLLAQSWKIFDNNAASRNSVDSRAAAIMPAIGLAATLVTGIGFTVLKDATLSSATRWIILVTYLVSLVYLLRTMFLLFVVHGAANRSTADPSDLPPPPAAGPGVISGYDRRLACKIMRYTVLNYQVNNRQSDALFVAQQAFRNAIITVVLGGAIAGVLIFFGVSMTASLPNYFLYAAG